MLHSYASKLLEMIHFSQLVSHAVLIRILCLNIKKQAKYIKYLACLKTLFVNMNRRLLLFRFFYDERFLAIVRRNIDFK